MERELLSFTDIVSAVKGRVFHVPGQPGRVCSVVIDSRKVIPFTLFVPLQGIHTDGHHFLSDAISKGASMLFVNQDFLNKSVDSGLPDSLKKEVSIIIVPDTLTALQDLAKEYVRQFPSLYKIGITGSNGKTTTKEIVGSILKFAGKTIINEGNLNSEIGLPLSVFAILPKHAFGVFEMGMNHKGEMDILSDILKPDTALITNIGIAHIGILGSKDAIAEEKKKICAHFDGKQTAFLYEDEPYFTYLAKELNGKIIPYGPKNTKGFEGFEDLGLDGMTINWEGSRIHFPLFGTHNLLNALGAISLAREIGVDKADIISGLEDVKPLFGRSQVLRGRVTIIQDCYNSNPDSVREVLGFLKKAPWKGRKILVLGSMLELGEKSELAHKEIVLLADSLHPDFIYLFGEEFERIQKEYIEENNGVPLYWTIDITSLINVMKEFVRDGDLILLKGSRGVELERLIPELQII